MNQKNLIEQMNEAFSEKLRTVPFPVQRLSYSWKANALKAFCNATPPKVGLSNEMFLAILKKERLITSSEFALTYLEFAVLSNNMESTSMRELGIELTEYDLLLSESATHVEFYAEQTNRMRREVELSFADEKKMRDALERDKDKSFMKPVKAQA